MLSNRVTYTFLFSAFMFGFTSLSNHGAVYGKSYGLPDFTTLVEKASPAVVNIRTTQEGNTPQANMPGLPRVPELDENDPMYEFFKRFFPPGGNPGQGPPRQPPSPRGQPPRGVGSGFLVSSDGYILSNHHVVSGAGRVIVTFTDRREFTAKVIGSDQRTDVALLKIEGKGFPSLKMGDTSKLKVGAWVVAIGSPFGLENTVTAGIVSALGRDTGDYLPFIQTDVAVNPGNSGGPLLNLNGEVIGINSQIYSRTGGFMGISFAIPIDEANLVAEQLKVTGKVTRGRIGVLIGEVSKDVADGLGLKAASGALVRSVDPDGPSGKAGVKPGDIILMFEGKKIDRVSDLPRVVGRTKPGTIASVRLWRAGKSLSLKVEVEEMAAQGTANFTPEPEKPVVTVFNWLGIAVEALPIAIAKKLKLRGGVVISSVKGAGSSAGLVSGDIITSMNNQSIQTVKEFSSMVGTLDRSKVVVLLVRRGEEAFFIPIKP